MNNNIPDNDQQTPLPSLLDTYEQHMSASERKALLIAKEMLTGFNLENTNGYKDFIKSIKNNSNSKSTSN